MNIKKTILIIIIMTFPLMGAFAQTEVTTKDGKKVILYEDSTWKYAAIETETSEMISYECSDLIFTEIDKVTGKSLTAAKERIIISDDGGNTGFGIDVLQGQKTIILVIQVSGAGNCIDEEDKMNVLFRDGTRLELINSGEFNCDAYFKLYFGGVFRRVKELLMFRTKEVETMRVWTNDGYVEKDFSAEQSKQFMKTIDCLIVNY